MKKILISIGSVALIVGAYVIYANQTKIANDGYFYSCKYEAVAPVGLISFSIKKQSDGQLHLIIASKPPQTNIIVNKNTMSNGDTKYTGDGIEVSESKTNLKVVLNGEILSDCSKEGVN